MGNFVPETAAFTGESPPLTRKGGAPNALPPFTTMCVTNNLRWCDGVLQQRRIVTHYDGGRISDSVDEWVAVPVVKEPAQ